MKELKPILKIDESQVEKGKRRLFKILKRLIRKLLQKGVDELEDKLDDILDADDSLCTMSYYDMYMSEKVHNGSMLDLKLDEFYFMINNDLYEEAAKFREDHPELFKQRKVELI